MTANAYFIVVFFCYLLVLLLEIRRVFERRQRGRQYTLDDSSPCFSFIFSACWRILSRLVRLKTNLLKYFAIEFSLIFGVFFHYNRRSGGRNTCINDGNEPSYMSAWPDAWISESIEDCCNMVRNYVPLQLHMYVFYCRLTGGFLCLLNTSTFHGKSHPVYQQTTLQERPEQHHFDTLLECRLSFKRRLSEF